MAGVDAETCLKDAEQEEWRDACLHREIGVNVLPEDMLLAQAESEGSWWAVSVGAGAGRRAGAEAGARLRAGMEAGAGRLAAQDAAVAPERTSLRRGELGRQMNRPWWQ